MNIVRVIAAMEVSLLHLTTQKTLCVKISRARDHAALLMGVVRRPRLTTRNQRESRPYRTDRRPVCVPNNKLGP